jgi:murein DD-endopeptidase MepM/ murein hydrolase activator NlpD
VRVQRWVVAVVAAALSLVLAVPAAADPHDDKARVDAELAAASADLEAATAKSQQAAASYGAAVAALPAAQDALAEAKGDLAAAEAAVSQAQRDVAAAKAVSIQADQQFNAAADLVDQARAGVGRVATATYKGGNFLLLESLIDSGSPNELARRMGYLDVVASDQRDAVRRLTDARAQAREERSRVAGASREAQVAADRARRALIRSTAAAADAAKANDRVQALIGQRQAALSAANAERGSVLAQYESLKAESARVEAQLRAAAARHRSGPVRSVTPLGPDTAFFLMPVHGHKTSDFGLRFHPIYHTWLMHTGLDLGAGAGSAILAAADGEVVQAGWHGGYGNLTCVLHGQYQGKELATCYGHQSQILVHTGQQVRRGELIGRVGSTGTSTGPHLHFEVRVSGTPVDPQKWLPACLC